MVCTDAAVDVNMVAYGRLGWLISPLFSKSAPKDIEVSAEITLTKVVGVCATPTDWLPDPLFDAAG